MILSLNALIVDLDDDGNAAGDSWNRPAEPGADVAVTISYTPAAGRNTADLVVYRLNSDGNIEYLDTTYAGGS